MLDTVTGKRRYTDLQVAPIGYDISRVPLSGPLVLRANGIGAIATSTHDGFSAITRFATTGPSRTIVHSDDVDFQSLRLNAGAISWLQAGQIHTQPLR